MTLESMEKTIPAVTTVSASGEISRIGTGSSGIAFPPIIAFPITGSSRARIVDLRFFQAAFFFFFSSAFSFSSFSFAFFSSGVRGLLLVSAGSFSGFSELTCSYLKTTSFNVGYLFKIVAFIIFSLFPGIRKLRAIQISRTLSSFLIKMSLTRKDGSSLRLSFISFQSISFSNISRILELNIHIFLNQSNKLIQKHVFRHSLYYLSFGKDYSLAISTRYSVIRFLCLSGSVNRATHNGNF